MSADTAALDGWLAAAAEHARVMGDQAYDCACGARVDWSEAEWDDGVPLCGDCAGTLVPGPVSPLRRGGGTVETGKGADDESGGRGGTGRG